MAQVRLLIVINDEVEVDSTQEWPSVWRCLSDTAESAGHKMSLRKVTEYYGWLQYIMPDQTILRAAIA